MRRRQVNAIFAEEAKRNQTIYLYGISITLVAIVTLLLGISSIKSGKKDIVKYNEKSDVSYNVEIANNEFFANNKLDENNKYIATLIKNIEANFNYSISVLEKNFDYIYGYKIVGDIDVREKDARNSLYKKEIVLKDRVEKNASSNEEVNISEKLNINYNKYNDLIKKFINIYELDNTVSTLTVSLVVDVRGKEDTTSKTHITSLNIPLTTKTVGIDIEKNSVNESDKYMLSSENNFFSFIVKMLFVLFALLEIAIIYKAYEYLENTKTNENVYESSLRKILNNYHSYIQKVNNDFSLKEYKVLKLDSFRELVEVRDTIEKPILMIEDENKKEARFVIIENKQIVYMYELCLSNIKKVKENKGLKRKIKNERKKKD